MRKIRKLYFRNAAGERYGLNGENGVYATGLSGFGLSLSPSFSDLAHGFFSLIDEESDPQGSLGFTLVFTRNPYHAYNALVDWLASAGSLTLIYDPTGAQEYCRTVSVSGLQKGEKTSVGWLEVPCSMPCHAPWYMPQPTELTLLPNDDSGVKRYPYRYTPDLSYGVGRTSAFSGTIAGAGHIPAALELSYYGAIGNPTIKLTGSITGKVYGVCSVAASFGGTDTLRVSTRYEDSYVIKIAADGTVTDLLDNLDLTTVPFFRIPVNEPCIITIESDTVVTGRADLLIYYYFRSV